MQISIFESILILLLLAVAINVLFGRLKIPAIVGYIVVGILAGPHILRLLADRQDMRGIAEFGIVFLLFTIGLEFSLSRLIAMRKIVFGYGLAEVSLCMMVVILIGYLLHIEVTQTIVIGSVIALSSTAIVSKLLSEQLELHSNHGVNAIGILLFQDLAVVPLLILIPSLVTVNIQTITLSLIWALVKGTLAITVILILGRYFLRPLFYLIAYRQAVELFTLAALFITLLFAWITQELGLSLAFGAFLAGIMLGETEFRHQIEADIRPFRDVLVALFFISIGVQMNLHIVLEAWHWLLLLLIALLIFKFLLVYVLGLLFGNDLIPATRTGLILAQGGEFGFALLMLAMTYNVLPEDYGQVIYAGILVSMIISSFIIRFNGPITQFFFFRASRLYETRIKKGVLQDTKKMAGHVIICGFGRTGQNIARIMEQAAVPFIAFDLDSKRVNDAQLAGDQVFYADATHWEILKSAHLVDARAIVVTLSNLTASRKIIETIRLHNQRIAIIARAYDDVEAQILFKAGATEVIPDTSEASLVLASHVLMLLRIPRNKVRRIINRIRARRYDLLHWVFPASVEVIEEENNLAEGLHAIILSEEARAIGKTIKELDLKKHHIQITRIRRGNKVINEPSDTVKLQAADVLVLHGPIEKLDQAEAILI